MISNTDPLRRIFLEKLEAVVPFFRVAGVVDLDSAVLRTLENWEDQDAQEYGAFQKIATLQGAKQMRLRQEQSRRSKTKKEAEGAPGATGGVAHTNSSVEEGEPDGTGKPVSGRSARPKKPSKTELDQVHHFPGVPGEMRGGDAAPELWLALAGRYEREERQKGGWKVYCRNMYRASRAEQLRLGYSEDATLYEIFGYR